MDMLSFSWSDVFYITDLDDGTRTYRSEKETSWYNLCMKPNPYYLECEHYCIGCGSNYEKMLKLISKYVSCYRNPENVYDMLRGLSDRGKCGATMLEKHYRPWWQEYGNTDYVMCYNDDIDEAIEIGKQTVVYGDSFSNVKVTYNENEDSLFIEGRWGEWFEELVDTVMSFKGYTKVEFFKSIEDFVTVDACNQIFHSLRKHGCKGIKQMKRLNMYRWLDVLAPLMNGWYFGSINDVYSAD